MWRTLTLQEIGKKKYKVQLAFEIRSKIPQSSLQRNRHQKLSWDRILLITDVKDKKNNCQSNESKHDRSIRHNRGIRLCLPSR